MSVCDFSALPTEALALDFPMPSCTYTIRKDELDGPILRYARVGDAVVHRWECQSGKPLFRSSRQKSCRVAVCGQQLVLPLPVISAYVLIPKSCGHFRFVTPVHIWDGQI